MFGLPMIAGLILAGGSGLRLGGVRKADLRLGNVPLRRHAVSRIFPQVDELLLSVSIGSIPSDRDFIELPDDPNGVAGPAAGLLAGSRWCAARDRDSILVSLSVDTPLFPSDFVARGLPLLGREVGCIMAGYNGRDYPTIALWRVPTLVGVIESFENTSKGPRLRDIANRVGVRMCRYDDLGFNPFMGVNTLPDLLAISRVLGTKENSA